MPNIQVDLDVKSNVNRAHTEFVRLRGTIETLVEGPPVFTDMQATGCTFVVSQDFLDFLRKKNVPFKSA